MTVFSAVIAHRNKTEILRREYAVASPVESWKVKERMLARSLEWLLSGKTGSSPVSEFLSSLPYNVTQIQPLGVAGRRPRCDREVMSVRSLRAASVRGGDGYYDRSSEGLGRIDWAALAFLLRSSLA